MSVLFDRVRLVTYRDDPPWALETRPTLIGCLGADFFLSFFFGSTAETTPHTNTVCTHETQLTL